jgi:pilus assembly protein CpaE
MTVLASPQSSPLGTDERRQLQAFVLDEDTRKVVDQVVADLMVPGATVHKGGVREAIRQLGVQRSPRLLIVDLSDIELPLSAMNELAEVCEPGVTVIAIGARNDVGLFRDLLTSGVSDYLVKPIAPALLQRSLLSVADSAAHDRQDNRLGRLIGVTGTRGGAGVTMLTTGIAWTIAQKRRRRVALVDLDLQYGSVALALNLEPCHGLREALEQPGRIDGLFVERALARHSETLYVFSGEESLTEALVPDSAAFDVLIRELRNKFHYAVVDMPRQVSSSTQHILQNASQLVLVTDLSLAGMRDTVRHLTMMPGINAACQLTIVANRQGEHREGEISRQEFETAIGRKIDFVIPFAPRAVSAAMNAGRPVPTIGGRVATSIHQITDRIVGASTLNPPRRPWLMQLLRR